MPTLTDYLMPAALQRLRDEFSHLARADVHVCDTGGRPVAEPSDAAPRAVGAAGRCEARVFAGRTPVGKIVARRGPETPGDDRWMQALVELMADVVGALCDHQRELHSRVEELTTLFGVTADFAGRGDLQSVLDRVTATVVQALKAKACSLRLLDEESNELVIKSVANLSRAYLRKGPVPVGESRIDQEVLATRRPVYIADERTDPRVLYPAEAKTEGIVSALCAPMIHKGRPIGVLRVYTGAVHEFDWFETSLLEAIAAQAASAIVNAQLHEEAVRAENMRRQLRLAGEVQRRMIPSQPPEAPGLNIAALYVPCFELGGDFYDFLDLPPGNIGVGICDVVGKGVRASLLMASVRASLRAHAKNVYSMSDVMRLVNNDLCSDTLTSDFATMFYGVIDCRSRRFTYANAGHVPPMLFRAGEARLLTTGGGVLGIEPDEHWSHESVGLESGDVILACTDGLMEAVNFRDESFGDRRVQEAAMAAIRDGRDAEGIANHVLWEMRRFAGLQTRFDDVTLLLIRVL